MKPFPRPADLITDDGEHEDSAQDAVTESVGTDPTSQPRDVVLVASNEARTNHTPWSDDELHTPSEISIEEVRKLPRSVEKIDVAASSDEELEDSDVEIEYDVGQNENGYFRQPICTKTGELIGEAEHCLYTKNPDVIGEKVIAYFMDGTSHATNTVFS